MKTIFITSSSSEIGKATSKLFTPKSLKGNIFINAGHRPAEKKRYNHLCLNGSTKTRVI
jgi:hypothetical protein